MQIQQVVVNLLRNAFEAVKGRDNPTVTVSTRREGDWLTVDRRGQRARACRPRDRADLFKAFSTSKRTGMGLGLSISRTIAQNHAGDLTVDPGGDGRGARSSCTCRFATPEMVGDEDA